MKRKYLIGALTMCVVTASGFAAPSVIELSTQNIRFVYKVDKKLALRLDSVGSLDGKWVSPLKGPLFVSTPFHGGNGPRYQGPLSVVTSDGSCGIELKYDSHTLTSPRPGVEHLTITMCDSIHPVKVELNLCAYSKENVFEQWMVLKNGMDTQLKVPRLDSLYFMADAQKDIFFEWYECDEYYTAGAPIREKLNLGMRVLESRDWNRHKSGPIPAFILGFGQQPDEVAGPCMITSLEWPGSTRLSFEVFRKAGRLNMEASVGVKQLLTPVVDPRGTLTTPRAISSFSRAGIGEASRNLHRWTRTHFLPGGDRLRPIDNNSWEGCRMGVNEASIIQMMKDSAELGIELYVLDDGWFGNGSDARVTAGIGLGDWQFNVDRFPNGLDNVMKAAAELGIEFGIWFEPEMVCKRSKLFREKPEWVMQNPGRKPAEQRGQLVLDVANPEVQSFMFKVVDDLLVKYPAIRFVKWDANSNINNPYSPYLGAERQGNMINAHNEGYLSVMKRLVEKHPTVDFQSCAAGGGRANYGAMRYSHTFWPSDDTNPIYRLGAQWNFSRFMPALTMTAHVTHAGGEHLRPKFRTDVSMMGQLGMEVDTRTCTPEYLAGCRAGIVAYKQVRPIVQQGDQYRHAHPADSATPSMNFVSQDKKSALVLAYQLAGIREPRSFNAPVSGLDPKRVYTLTEINLPKGDAQPRLAEDKNSRTGAEWMKTGVSLVFSRQNDSAAVLLK